MPVCYVLSPTVKIRLTANQKQILHFKHYCSCIEGAGGRITCPVHVLPKHKVSKTIPRLQSEIALAVLSVTLQKF